MPNFESSLGNRKLGQSSLREIDIPDESEFNESNIVNPAVRKQAGMPALNQASIQSLQNRLIESERDPEEIEREFREAREAKKAKLAGKERLNDGAKRRLEMLLNMTRTTHSVELDGNMYVMQTIPSKAVREAIVMASQYDGTVESPFEVRKQFLARSLVQIAGVEFEQFIGTSSLDSKLAFIDELDEALLNRLYDEYLEMDSLSKSKYSVKTDADVKEIIADLKK